MPVFLRKLSNDALLRGLIGCALTAALVIATLPARAEDQEPPEDKIMDGIMGAFGLTRGGPNIEYRERSPLVLPRGSTLPPPQSAEIKNPNWPVEPEVKQAKALAAKHKNDGRTSSQVMDDNMRPLPRSEIEMGRTNRAQNNAPGRDGSEIMSPSDLGYKGGLFGTMFGKGDKHEAAAFTGEPPRTSLTAPPTGYQTPSPNAAYAVGKERYTPKAIDYYNDRKYEK